jgi:hypothetical protein
MPDLLLHVELRLDQWPMSLVGHSRPMQPVLLAGSCPLRSESDLHPACRELTRCASTGAYLRRATAVPTSPIAVNAAPAMKVA